MKKYAAPLAAILPALAILFLVSYYFSASLFQFLPTLNDEVYYVSAIRGLASAGLNSGYFVFDEIPSPIAAYHFGVHGIWYLIPHAAVMAILGPNPGVIIAFNLVLISGALFLFYGTSRLTPLQAVLCGVFLATFPAFLLYAPSGMQEGLHFAFAIGAAVFFNRLFVQGERTPRSFIIGGCVLLFYAALVRQSWAPLIWMALAFATRRNSNAQWKTFFLFGALMIVHLLIPFTPFSSTSAPAEPWSPVRMIAAAFQSSIWTGFGVLYYRGVAQWGGFISGTNGHPLEAFQRLEIVIFCGALFLEGGARATKKWRSILPDFPPEEIFFHLFNLGVPVALNLCLKEISNWGDFRVLAPHILLSFLLLVSRRRFKPAGLLLLANFLLLPTSIGTFQGWRVASFIHNTELKDEFVRKINSVVVYRPDKNAWCNTVLSNSVDYPKYVSLFPAGIGVSTMLDPQRMGQTIKSKYILETPNGFPLIDHSTLRELTTTPIGKIYFNETSGCQ